MNVQKVTSTICRHNIFYKWSLLKWVVYKFAEKLVYKFFLQLRRGGAIDLQLYGTIPRPSRPAVSQSITKGSTGTQADGGVSILVLEGGIRLGV